MDNTLKAEIIELLKTLKASGDHTFLYVTHDDREMKQLADKIAILEEGEIYRQGTVAELVSAPEKLIRSIIRPDSPIDMFARGWE